MLLAPGAYCSYKTTHDTKVEYDKEKVEVSYYPYEGNNLPVIGMCKLAEKTKRTFILGEMLVTGLFGGILSGNCGYFVVLHNTNLQVETKITLYRNTEEFEGAVALAATAASALLFTYF